jgi:hypothetical protein
MIIHLPESLKTTVQCDRDGVAFSTDITPSLYYLLGQRPTVRDPIYGRPLCTASVEERAAYAAPDYLIASSYAAVYGILDKGGRQLFISDAVNERDGLYDVESGELLTFSAGQQAAWQARMREMIERIDGVYGFRP